MGALPVMVVSALVVRTLRLGWFPVLHTANCDNLSEEIDLDHLDPGAYLRTINVPNTMGCRTNQPNRKVEQGYAGNYLAGREDLVFPEGLGHSAKMVRLTASDSL